MAIRTLGECIESLQRLTYENYQITVVDNGSVDGSVDKLRLEFKQIKIIDLAENTGFTGACNVGITDAINSEVDYIFLLNNDTLLDDVNILERMTQYLEENSQVGMISPVVLYEGTRSIWFGGGDVNRNTGIIKLWDHGKEYEKPGSEKASECSFLAGCALFMPIEVARKTGGFYEPYFLTSEESELCVRIMDYGYKLAVLESMSIYHKVSRSMGVESPLLVYFMYRNKLFFARRNAKSFTVWNLLEIVQYYLRGFLSFLKKGIMVRHLVCLEAF